MTGMSPRQNVSAGDTCRMTHLPVIPVQALLVIQEESQRLAACKSRPGIIGCFMQAGEYDV